MDRLAILRANWKWLRAMSTAFFAPQLSAPLRVYTAFPFLQQARLLTCVSWRLYRSGLGLKMKEAASLKVENYCEVSHAASTDLLETRWRFAPGGNGLLTGRLASTSFHP
jgi:hypothetical protein